MSHEARDIVRIYKKLREIVPESVTEQHLLKTLHSTIRTLHLSELNYPLECTRCGRCCTTSGYITMTEQEYAYIRQYLKEHGIRKRPRITRSQNILSFNGTPCPLYDKLTKSCLVYPVRPKVCRDFPREHLRRRSRCSEWPLVSFCQAADQLVVEQTLYNLEHPLYQYNVMHRLTP